MISINSNKIYEIKTYLIYEIQILASLEIDIILEGN
jgi:hypothetical protein